MSTSTALPFLETATRDGIEFVGLTVKAYDWLIEHGKIREDSGTELIEGLIVKKDRSALGEDPISIGNRHRKAILQLADLNTQLKSLGCFIQCQLPIWIPPRSEPEPDLCVAKGSIDDFSESKPAFGEILSVIEISDSSLRRDLGTKLNVYARAKMPEYIVVNLVDNVVLVHHNPSRGKYPSPSVFRSGDKLKISATGGKYVEIPVAKLL